MTYAVEKYTMPLAQQLADAWCHKMNHFWSIVEAVGCDLDYIYTAADIDGYEETLPWKTIADGCRVEEEHFFRVWEIRRMHPW